MLTSDIENFPGYPQGIGGPEMMMQLREQAERFGLEVTIGMSRRSMSARGHSKSGLKEKNFLLRL